MKKKKTKVSDTIGYYAGTIAHDGDYLDIHWSAGL